ncbi:MAG: peptide deformylase [Rickettsiaceae bacterium]|nr:peptide deformylase [Rickettsiaceae bacterium]
MSILKIITIPNRLLKQKSSLVEVVDDKIRSLIEDMLETMYHDNGIGLAAIQVGVPKRILVVDLSGMDEEEKKNIYPIKMVNPEFIYKSENMSIADEGCLSVPGVPVEISRHEAVTIKYLDDLGQEKTIECDGWLARCFQHEIDHLDGKTILDYLSSSIKRDVIIRKLSKAQRTEK